ncbi:hypothetical protein, partial [Paraburkholderia elongata]|uniref:hypothetical protein n=1 Tax=Paraburkholderia elongata TaxID=2675747 RepID=UPI001552B072
SVTNGTTLTLSPYNGNNISINGVPRQVPLAGVTGSNAGLTASTLYYVYASWTGAAIQLNFSTTGHSTASNGVEIKTGDGTQTLVGMIRTFTDGTFINTSQYSYLLNWFNRKTIAANINGTSVNFSNTGALAEISATYRVNFLTWADEAVYSQSDGGYTNNGINDNKVQNWIDGSSFGPAVDSYIPVANTLAVFVSAGAGTLSEGFHYSTLAGAVTAGTASISTLNMKVTVRG